MARGQVAIVAFTVVLATPAARADTLGEALAAHAAAVARIRTISFHFTSTVEHAGYVEEVQDGEYLRSGDDYRHIYRQGEVRFANYVTAERVTSLSQEPRTQPGLPPARAGIRPNAGPVGFPVYPWRSAMMVMSCKRGIEVQPLDEHLAEFAPRPTVRTEGGLMVIAGAGGRVMVRLDPKHDYLVSGRATRGTVGSGPGERAQTTDERITEFQEVATGIYFPKSAVREDRLGDKVVNRETVTYSAVKVNQPVEAAAFRPKYLDGTLVTDLIRGTEYVVGADGNPKGPEKPHTVVHVGVVNPNATDVKVGGPTAEEDRPGGWWLLPAGLSVLLAGLAVGLWRRSR